MIRYTNEESYDLSIAVWLADDEYDSSPVPGKYISVTSLLKPLRMIVMDQRVKEAQRIEGGDNVMDLSRFVPSRLGTAIHSSIEHSWTRILKDGTPAYKVALARLGYPEAVIDRIRVNPTDVELDTIKGIIPVFLEVRSFKTVGDWTIGGQFDFVGDGNAEDFKSMGVYGYRKGDKDEEQLLQGSLYRWLNPDIITSDTMKIQQIFTDWSKLDAMKFGNSKPAGKFKLAYPKTRILSKTLALKEMDEWVHRRIEVIDSLMDKDQDMLPRCDAEELWQDPPTYKYFKVADSAVIPGKRSTKNFDDFASAHARFMKDGSVGAINEVFAPVRRCGYCGGFDLCVQKDEYAAAGCLQLP